MTTESELADNFWKDQSANFFKSLIGGVANGNSNLQEQNSNQRKTEEEIIQYLNKEKGFLFRWHKGTLEESMATVVSFNNQMELETYIEKCIPEMFDGVISYGGIEIKLYGFDRRINWNTHIVSVRDNRRNESLPVGWTNKSIPNL